MAIKDRTRVAVIGAGSMANAVHYPSLASFEDVEIAAICDLNEGLMEATAEKYGIDRRFTNYREMIEAIAPDAVYAIGQPDALYPVWIWLLQQRLNLYIEKPLGLTIHQARSMAYLAEKHGCVTQVSFQRRTCPMVAQLREECLKRGPISQAVCEFYKRTTAPHFAARDYMMDDGVHAIDTVRWMCGGEVTKVQSAARRIGGPSLDFFAALLEFDNGATGLMLTNWTSGRRVFRVQMHAPGVCAEAEHEAKGYLYLDGDTHGIEYDTRKAAGSDANYIFGGFRAKNREFIDAVRSGGLPPSHFGDAVKTMEIAERILAAALLEGN